MCSSSTRPCEHTAEALGRGSAWRRGSASDPVTYDRAVHLTAVLAPVCTALSVSFIWPQVLRIYRMNTVDGLAPIGTLHGLCGCSLWTMYGVARGVVPLMVSNGVVGIALLLIAAAQIRHRALRPALLFGTLAGIAAVGGAALSISPVLAGWLAIVVGVTSIVPQTFHVARADDLDAVSVPMYALVVLNAVLWSLYGVLIHDWLIVLPNVLILPCALFVGTKAWRKQGATVLRLQEA